MKRNKRLIYRLKLSFIIKIHNVISIMHFKSIIIIISDSYKHYSIVSSLVIINNEKEYEIKHLIRKRLCRFNHIKHIITQYLTR